jgi:hypothetical protein
VRAHRGGEAWCWGSNALGQAGGKGTAIAPRPRKVSLPPIAHLATGSSNTCATTQDERVYRWGQNRNEQSTAAEVGFEPEVWSRARSPSPGRAAHRRPRLHAVRHQARRHRGVLGFVRALLSKVDLAGRRPCDSAHRAIANLDDADRHVHRFAGRRKQ